MAKHAPYVPLAGLHRRQTTTIRKHVEEYLHHLDTAACALCNAVQTASDAAQYMDDARYNEHPIPSSTLTLLKHLTNALANDDILDRLDNTLNGIYDNLRAVARPMYPVRKATGRKAR